MSDLLGFIIACILLHFTVGLTVPMVIGVAIGSLIMVSFRKW